MANDPAKLTVTCPACGRRGHWFADAFGPFCSRRCRLVDLGKWLKEEHAISEPLRPDAFEAHADLPGAVPRDAQTPGGNP